MVDNPTELKNMKTIKTVLTLILTVMALASALEIQITAPSGSIAGHCINGTTTQIVTGTDSYTIACTSGCNAQSGYCKEDDFPSYVLAILFAVSFIGFLIFFILAFLIKNNLAVVFLTISGLLLILFSYFLNNYGTLSEMSFVWGYICWMGAVIVITMTAPIQPM